MKYGIIPLNQRLWAVKFLIENFFNKKEEIKQNKAVAIDKVQSFFLAYSPLFHKSKSGNDKKLSGQHIKFLQEPYGKSYISTTEDTIESQGAWFSSEKAKNNFLEIYRCKQFDYSKPEDRLLAFNLADGILENPEVKEYAVIESLYYKSKVDINLQSQLADKNFGLENWLNRSVKNQKLIYKFLEEVSEQEIIKEFSRIGHENITEYFLYQKKHNYPLINFHLYNTWVLTSINILEQIVRYIKKTKNQSNSETGNVEKYFYNTLNEKKFTKTLKIENQEMSICLDCDLKRRIAFKNNELIYLICNMFESIDVEMFDVCHNSIKKCDNLFVKFPKNNKEYCSRNCAAYHKITTERAKCVKKK